MESNRIEKLTISDIAHCHNMEPEELRHELVIGIKDELQHTADPEKAYENAVFHLKKMPDYYTKIKAAGGLENHLHNYAKGGEIFQFPTPTGQPSNLTYLQQVLVRTAAFKKFFGDWESAARDYISSGSKDIVESFKGVSLILDAITLEPRVVYHGTNLDEEFFKFDVTSEISGGRPYAYFAFNKEYSENFNQKSNLLPLLYECFVNIRKPFSANDINYVEKFEDATYWLNTIAETMCLDKYHNLDNFHLNATKGTINSQIGDYIRDVFNNSRMGNGIGPFWFLMSRDSNKEFKRFLVTHGYDGILYTEQINVLAYDLNNSAEWTFACTIFEPEQAKLADGRNIEFNPMSQDIRYKKGGNLNSESEPALTGKQKLDKLILGNDSYAIGGEVIAKHDINPNNAKKGGYFHGRSHAEGGIKAVNIDNGQLIEVEGKEVIITKGAVEDDSLHEFEGEMLTNKQILSKINQSGGGVAFADGGELSHCGCSGKHFKYGGETLEDYEIVNRINKPYKHKEAIKNAHTFLNNIKG